MADYSVAAEKGGVHKVIFNVPKAKPLLCPTVAEIEHIAKVEFPGSMPGEVCLVPSEGEKFVMVLKKHALR